MGYWNFDVFKMRYIIKFRIRALSPLSVKSGRVIGEDVDNPIVRYVEKPYIPGSSLKGVFRSVAEGIARELYNDIPDKPCDIFRQEELDREKNMDNYVPCIVCRVFGGPTIASHVTIFDAVAVKYSVDKRVRISINRVLGSVYSGRGPFKEEFVTPSSVFDGGMEVENIDLLDSSGKEASLFNDVMRLFLNGSIQVGSNKSVGMGRIKVEDIKVSKVYFDEHGNLKEDDVTDLYLKVLGV